MQTLKSILHYTNIVGLLWTLCLCIVNISLPRWVLLTGLYIFFATWLIEVIWERRWQTKPNREWLFFGLLILFFLLAFLYWPWDGNHIYFHHHIEQRLPLLGFGIVGLFGLNKHYSRATIINTMILLSVFSVLYVATRAGWHHLIHSHWRAWYFTDARNKFVNAHMWYDFFLNSTLIGIWYLLFQSERKPALWQKITYPLAAIIMLVALYFSEGRTGFFTAFALLGIMLIIAAFKRTQWLGYVITVIASVALIGISTTHQRMSKQDLTGDLRYAYWKAAAELIEQKPVLGYGMSRAQEEFDQVNIKYADESFMEYLRPVRDTHYIDCHNQYIQTTLEYGFVGLILLLAIYLSPIWITFGKKGWGLALFYTLISMGQSLFDMFITGGRFNTLYCILMLLAISVKDDYLCSDPHEA